MGVKMDSKTRINLESSQIERLIKNAFGQETQIVSCEEVKEGWFNTIYSICLSNRGEVVLKIAPPSEVKTLRYEKDIMKTEVEVLKLLKEKTIVPVPKVYYYDTTGSEIKNEYFIMERIAGTPYNKIKKSITEEERKTIETELGLYNRIINDIKGTKFGPYSHPEKTSDKWFDAFMMLVCDVLQDGKEYDVKLPMENQDIEKLILCYSYAFNSVGEPSLIHWDLHDGNVIVSDDRHIAGIIDCDRALWGDPLIEVYFGKFFNHEYFKLGYGIKPIFDTHMKIRRAIYDIYLDLIMVVESYYRGFDDNHKKWTYEQLENDLKALEQRRY
jgi:aminoglycoside phosphotransferase (APT) family kinase protein